MIASIHFPDSIFLDEVTTKTFCHFMQQMANRRTVGAIRYGDQPKRRQKYMSRLKKELSVYIENGNHEQLINIAVYAFLESYAPENTRYYFDPTTESATRNEFGGEVKR